MGAVSSAPGNAHIRLTLDCAMTHLAIVALLPERAVPIRFDLCATTLGEKSNRREGSEVTPAQREVTAVC